MSSVFVPHHVPQVLYNNREVAEKTMKGTLTPEFVRSNHYLKKVLYSGQIPQDFLRGIHGLPLFMAYQNKQLARTIISIEYNFNPDLAKESNYFGKLDAFVRCVEKNAGSVESEEEANKVCRREWNEVRMSALNKDLLYHNVNRRFYLDQLTYKRGEAPF